MLMLWTDKKTMIYLFAKLGYTGMMITWNSFVWNIVFQKT